MLLKKKNVSVLLFALLLSSCSFDSEKDSLEEGISSDTQHGQVQPQVPRVIDSDGDGLPDMFDPSPDVAIFPRVAIHRVDQLTIGVSESVEENVNPRSFFIENTRNSRTHPMTTTRDRNIRKKILGLHREKARNPLFAPNNEENLTIEDFYTTPVSMWTLADEANFNDSIEGVRLNQEGSLVLEFYVLLQDLKHINQISDIKFELRANRNMNLGNMIGIVSDTNGSASVFNLRENEPDLYTEQRTRLLNRNFPSRTASEIVKNSHQVELRITDFKYESHGVSLSFADQIGKVKSSSSLFVISSPNGIEYKFIKAGSPIIEGFQKISKDITVADNGGLFSLQGLRNALPIPADTDRLDPSDYNTMSLLLIGAHNLNASSQAGQTYIISAARGADLARSKRMGESEQSFSNEDAVKVGVFYPGERAEISVRSIVAKPIYRIEKSLVEIKELIIEPSCAARLCAGPRRDEDCYDAGIEDRCGNYKISKKNLDIGVLEINTRPMTFSATSTGFQTEILVSGDPFNISDISNRSTFEIGRNSNYMHLNIDVPEYFDEKVDIKIQTESSGVLSHNVGLLDNPCRDSRRCTVKSLDGKEIKQQTVKTNNKVSTHTFVKYLP